MNETPLCSGCGTLKDMPLYKRTYHCDTCGLIMDRDENSAVNILHRYLARLEPHTQSERGVLHDTQVEVVSRELTQLNEAQQLDLWSTCLTTF